MEEIFLSLPHLALVAPAPGDGVEKGESSEVR